MTWAAIITAILQVLGPILSQLLQQWLGKLLDKTAKTLPPPSEEMEAGDNHATLLKAALDATPRRQVLRRAFLRHAIEAVPAAVAGSGKLDPADAKELAALAGAAVGE